MAAAEGVMDSAAVVAEAVEVATKEVHAAETSLMASTCAMYGTTSLTLSFPIQRCANMSSTCVTTLILASMDAVEAAVEAAVDEITVAGTMEAAIMTTIATKGALKRQLASAIPPTMIGQWCHMLAATMIMLLELTPRATICEPRRAVADVLEHVLAEVRTESTIGTE